MKLFTYIKSEYKSWLIGILRLPFIIGFEKLFSELELMSELKNWFIFLRILCLTFVASFFVFLTSSFEFGFDKNLIQGEYESEDLNRFKRILKKSLITYSIALSIWVIGFLTIIFVLGHTISIWKMIYLMVFPMIFIGLMIDDFNDIKAVYNWV